MRKASRISYFALLSALAAFCYLRPTFHPDVTEYATASLLFRGESSEESHRRVFQNVTTKFAPELNDCRTTFWKATYCPTIFWRTMIENPRYFDEQIPFYSVKPLFIWLGGALGRLFGPVGGFQALSAVSVFAIGVVLFAWLRQPWVCAAFMLNLSVIAIGRDGTPDALSTALVLLGLLCFYRMRLGYGISFSAPVDPCST